MSATIETLGAEVYRLRAALERIASINPLHPNCETAVDMARTALNRREKQPEETGELFANQFKI